MWFIQYEHVVEERDSSHSIDIDRFYDEEDYLKELNKLPWIETSREIISRHHHQPPSWHAHTLHKLYQDTVYKRHIFKFTFACKES